jgi:chromosome segregation ATPase
MSLKAAADAQRGAVLLRALDEINAELADAFQRMAAIAGRYDDATQQIQTAPDQTELLNRFQRLTRQLRQQIEAWPVAHRQHFEAVLGALGYAKQT